MSGVEKTEKPRGWVLSGAKQVTHSWAKTRNEALSLTIPDLFNDISNALMKYLSSGFFFFFNFDGRNSNLFL